MKSRRHLLVSLLLIGPAVAVGHASAQGQQPQDRLQVMLMTMGPGREVWSRFGHDAIVIADTVAGTTLVYNYGTFDFNQPGFIRNFVEGRPRYWLGVATWNQTIREYQAEGRDVEVQILALTREQKAELAYKLAQNALPENREYVYDYFRDNCATRVRDMLDDVLGGALARTTKGVPGEGTLRFQMARSLTNDLPMYLGILTAMGPSVDQPLDQWDEMFLPGKVQERVRELRVADSLGRQVPLVEREVTVLRIDRYHVLPAPPSWALRMLAAGVVLAVLILLGSLGGALGMFGRVVGGLWAIVAGLAGVLLLFLWLATNHVDTAWNRNLLLLSPLALPLVLTLWGGRRPRRWLGTLAIVVAVLAVVGLLLSFSFAVSRQVNLQFALLYGPSMLALGYTAWRRDRRRQKD